MPPVGIRRRKFTRTDYPLRLMSGKQEGVQISRLLDGNRAFESFGHERRPRPEFIVATADNVSQPPVKCCGRECSMSCSSLSFLIKEMGKPSGESRSAATAKRPRTSTPRNLPRRWPAEMGPPKKSASAKSLSKLCEHL